MLSFKKLYKKERIKNNEHREKFKRNTKNKPFRKTKTIKSFMASKVRQLPRKNANEMS